MPSLTKESPVEKRPSSEAIYDAAIELWSERGYAGASLRDIATRVNLKVASLYNHIESREELLVRILRDNINLLLRDTDAAVAAVDDPLDKVRQFMRTAIIYRGEHRREAFIGDTELRALTPESRPEIKRMRDEYEQRLIDLLEAAENAGVISLPDRRMAAYAALAICSQVSSWYRSGSRLSIEEVADRLIEMYTPLNYPAALKAAE